MSTSFRPGSATPDLAASPSREAGPLGPRAASGAPSSFQTGHPLVFGPPPTAKSTPAVWKSRADPVAADATAGGHSLVPHEERLWVSCTRGASSPMPSYLPVSSLSSLSSLSSGLRGRLRFRDREPSCSLTLFQLWGGSPFRLRSSF